MHDARDTIEYRGQGIRLSKAYDDFDSYKNDPNNIAPFENDRVKRLVIEAPVGRSFSNRLSVFQETQQIAFPGYGSGSGRGIDVHGNELLAIDIEIPRAQGRRYLLFRARNGRYDLLDDFEEREIAYPYSIRESSDSFVFVDSHGAEFFRRTVAHHSEGDP